MGLLNLMTLLVLGAAWLITVRLIFARRASQGDDLMQRGMTIAGWLMVLLGLAGVIGALVGAAAVAPCFVAIAVLIMAIDRYRHNERRSLLWALALAAERGIPLEQAARAFAHERHDETGLRAARLAAELERGAPLPEALRNSRNPLPFDARLACGVGWQAGRLGPALRRVIRFHEEFDEQHRHALEKSLYLCLLLASFCWMLTALLVRIVPGLDVVYMEFGIDLPAYTAQVIKLGDAFATKKYWIFFVPVYFVTFVLVLASSLYYLGWITWEPWLLRRLWRRIHTAWILRMLAFTVSQGRPLEQGVQLLSANYPTGYIGQRLYEATGMLAAGRHWCEALHAKKLLSPGDAAVLMAAERAGNLPWALEELAESNLRRLTLRFRALLNIAFPLAILTCGAILFGLVFSVLHPLFLILDHIARY